MDTPCDYCGSKRFKCYTGEIYEECPERDRIIDAAARTLWNDAVDEELADYPDDDYSWEAPQVAIFKDSINTPAHYAGYQIEPITFIMRNNLPYAEGNVVKYVCRHDKKNGLEDIEKAIKYLKFIAKDTYGAEL